MGEKEIGSIALRRSNELNGTWDIYIYIFLKNTILKRNFISFLKYSLSKIEYTIYLRAMKITLLQKIDSML